MKVRNISAFQKYSRYWDEGNINLVPWHRKKFTKRYFRKKALRDLFHQLDKDDLNFINGESYEDIDFLKYASDYW